MGMFYDFLIERSDDAAILVHLFVGAPGPPLTLGKDESIDIELAFSSPVGLDILRISERAKTRYSRYVPHPVEYELHVSVKDSRGQAAADCVVSVLCAALPMLGGALSLFAYGENVLFQQLVPQQVEVFDASRFWLGDRLARIRSVLNGPLIIHNEQKPLDQ